MHRLPTGVPRRRLGAPPIDLTRTINHAAEIVDVQEEPLRVAVSAMTSPKETLVTYHELLHYSEVEVLRAIALGHTAKKVGEQLSISTKTVEGYPPQWKHPETYEGLRMFPLWRRSAGADSRTN